MGDHRQEGSRRDTDTPVDTAPDSLPTSPAENLARTGDDQSDWTYRWQGRRIAQQLLFTGQVEHVGGADGERRRLELAWAVRGLLRQADTRQGADDPGKDHR